MKITLIIVVCLLFAGQVACSKKKLLETSNVSAGVNPTEGDRSQARVFLEQGKELYRTDQDEKSVEAFQQAIKLDPDLAEPYFRLGLSLTAVGKEEEAEDAYKKSVEKYKKYLDDHGKDAEAHYNMGQSYAGLHLYSEAVRAYRQASNLKSDDANIYYDLGTALIKLAQYDAAAAAFSKSLELDPENYRAEDSLEEAREGVQRIRAGRKHQEELLKKEKESETKEGDASPRSATPPAVQAKN